jgi:hypothetical protein
MSPFEVFDPSSTLDPSRYVGEAGAARLLEAARHFPGGPAMLVLALFFAPVGPGIPAGVLLSRHVPLPAPVTFGLYACSDLIGALMCHPLFALLRRHGRRVRPIRWLGRRMMAVAMVGVPSERERLGPALFRVATVGFGVDVYTAGMLATALRLPRIAGWLSAIAGDLVWFALLLATSLATASIVDDDRVILLVMVVAMIVIPRLARRFIPALRPSAGAGAAPSRAEDPAPTGVPASRRTPPGWR